jgi:hypothetical protein
MDYVKNYEKDMYSWRTCKDYRYSMWLAGCRLGWVSFPGTACPQTNVNGNPCNCPSNAFIINLRD